MSTSEDDDLKPLLHRWRAPEPPEHLRARIFDARRADAQPAPGRRDWRWLLTGSVRIPVPAIVALVMLLVWLATGRNAPVPAESVRGEPPVSLADFSPPAEMGVRILGELP